MKKTFLTLMLLAVVTVMSAQSLQFEYEGTVYQNGQTVISTFDDIIFFEYVKEINIRNLSNQNIKVVVEQVVLEPAVGAMVSMCWGQCLAPGNHIVSDTVGISAQTLSDEIFSAHCSFTEGETGVVKAIYYAYDFNNPDDKTSIIVLSGETANVAEHSISLGQAYPNPASTQVNFNYNCDGNSDINVLVYNLLGQEVKAQSVCGSHGKICIPVDDLQPGIYFCSFQVNNEAVRTEKFIVKR